MYATGGKKVLNILILKILQEHSDSEHLLTQRDISNLLFQNYGVLKKGVFLPKEFLTMLNLSP